MFCWEVEKHESGKKLLPFIKEKLGSEYSAKQLKKAIESNLCQVNGLTERFASFTLGTGDRVDFKYVKPLSKISFEFNKASILYEDDFLLAYNKPAGISSESLEFIGVLRSYHPSLVLLHRLDKETTGVLMLTKTKEMHVAMIELFKRLDVHKTYLSLVDGVFSKRTGVIKNYLGKKHAYQGQTMWGEVSNKNGLYAETEWQVEKIGKQASLVRCFPKTGRTHQLRVHLSGLGHPILGDYQYAKKAFKCSQSIQQFLLHALEVSFVHPLLHRSLTIQAPIPAYFEEIMRKVL